MKRSTPSMEVPMHDATALRCSPWASSPLADNWLGLSADLIDRFVEVTSVQRELSRSARRGYRADLSALDQWMQCVTGHTLVTARTAELWAYFRERVCADLEPRLLDRLLASMREFYAFAQQGGCRDDDPAARLPAWFERTRRPQDGRDQDQPAVYAHG